MIYIYFFIIITDYISKLSQHIIYVKLFKNGFSLIQLLLYKVKNFLLKILFLEILMYNISIFINQKI